MILVYLKLILNFLIKFFQKKGKRIKYTFFIKKVFVFLKRELKKNVLFFFLLTLKKIKPFCNLKSVVINGKTFNIPFVLKIKQQKVFVLKWLLFNSFKKTDFFLILRLKKEILETNLFLSKTIKKFEKFHKTIELNKIFVNYKC